MGKLIPLEGLNHYPPVNNAGRDELEDLIRLQADEIAKMKRTNAELTAIIENMNVRSRAFSCTCESRAV